jgi:hypothetical protein
MKRGTVSSRVAAIALAGSLLGGAVALPVQAAPAKPKMSFAQRHPKLTAAAAGFTAYKVAKVTGNNRKQAGRKLNFAQRHPIVTGVATAMVTHHVIKKHTPKR